MSWYALKEPERTPEEEVQGIPPLIAYQLVEEGGKEPVMWITHDKYKTQAIVHIPSDTVAVLLQALFLSIRHGLALDECGLDKRIDRRIGCIGKRFKSGGKGSRPKDEAT